MLRAHFDRIIIFSTKMVHLIFGERNSCLENKT